MSLLSSLGASLEGQLALITGPPGTKKKELALRWMAGGEKEALIFVCIEQTPQEILENLKAYTDTDIAELKQRTQFLDMLSYRVYGETRKIENTTQLQGMTDLMALSAGLDRISKQSSKARFLISPISLIFIYNDAASVIDVLQTMAARMSIRGQTLLLLNHQGVLSTQLEVTLESLAKTVFETRTVKQGESSQNEIHVKFSPENVSDKWRKIGQ